LKKDAIKVLILNITFYGAEIRTLWKVHQKYLGRLEKISWTIVWEMKKYYIESGRRGISYIQKKEGRLTGLLTSYVGTAF
jgi:hypothetical protein